jgi:hypothetical protein
MYDLRISQIYRKSLLGYRQGVDLDSFWDNTTVWIFMRLKRTASAWFNVGLTASFLEYGYFTYSIYM